MRRPLLLLPLGLLAGLLAFACAWWLQTRGPRALLRGPDSELAWLRQEFRLTDEQFDRVVALHQAYQPTCAELCRRIAEQNQLLHQAALAHDSVTPELQELVRTTGRVRDDCRQAMLEHLYAVARVLPPDQAGRYLDLMLTATCVVQEARPIDRIHAPSPPRSASHHGHE